MPTVDWRKEHVDLKPEIPTEASWSILQRWTVQERRLFENFGRKDQRPDLCHEWLLPKRVTEPSGLWVSYLAELWLHERLKKYVLRRPIRSFSRRYSSLFKKQFEFSIEFLPLILLHIPIREASFPDFGPVIIFCFMFMFKNFCRAHSISNYLP